MEVNGFGLKTDSMSVNTSTATVASIWKKMESLQFTSQEFMLKQSES